MFDEASERARLRPARGLLRRPARGALAHRDHPAGAGRGLAGRAAGASSGAGRAAAPTSWSATASASTRRWWPAGAAGATTPAARARARAGHARPPRAPGAMAAVLGLPDERGRAALRGERVTSGRPTTTAPARWWSRAREAGVAAVIGGARSDAGAKAMRLRVAGAFHSPLMAMAADRLAPARRGGARSRPLDARSCPPSPAAWRPPTRCRELLLEQLTAPVRFTQAVQALVADGVTHASSRWGRAASWPGWCRRIDGDVTRPLPSPTPADAANRWRRSSDA